MTPTLPPVVVLDHSAELGGAEIGLVNMAREFGDHFHVVLLEDGPLVRMLADHARPPIVLDLNGRIGSALRAGACHGVARVPALWRTARQLRGRLLEILDEVGSEVLVVNTLRGALLVSAARLPTDVRCVVMLRDSVRPPYLSWVKSALVHACINRTADHVIANSGWTGRQLSTSAPVEVAPPFLAREYFDHPVAPAPGRVTRLLLLGRIAPWKGQLLGLRALGPLLDAGRCVVTVAGGAWFGEQRYLAEILTEADRHPNGSIRVVGHVEDVRSLIDAHDAVVHTSQLPEPFGQVVVQAMARGRVVVAADAGGPAEIVDHGRTGVLYGAGDAESLRSAVLDVLGWNERRIAAVCEAARRRSIDYHPATTARLLAAILGRDAVARTASRTPSVP